MVDFSDGTSDPPDYGPDGFQKQEPEITVADMLTLFTHGRIGEIELRNWLAEIYPSFARARRTDIDDWLEHQQAELEAQVEKEEEQLELDLEEEDV